MSQSSATLDQIRQRYNATPLPRFLAWWGRELAGMVPARLRRLLWRGESRILLRLQPDEVELLVWREAGLQTRARVPLEQADAVAATLATNNEQPARWLLLDDTRVLRKRMSLPLAAAARLREVLAHEIDRQTPFRADQVSFDYREIERQPASGQLVIELLALPLATLEDALGRLGPLSEVIDGVDVELEGRPLGVNLLPVARRTRRHDPVRWINLGLAAFAIACLGLALLQSLNNRRDALEQLQAEVEQRRLEARRVSLLREQLEDVAGGASFLANARQERPLVLAVIDDISRRFPDGTWLERMTINANRVTLIGLSGEASATVGWLQESPYLTSPALSGSVQPDPRSGNDRFTLAAGLRTPTEAADAPAP